jgi:DNA-binding transcriptional regulator YdaS (Cro superfamily)
MVDIQKLLQEQGRGAKSRIARELGVTPGAISQWREVPADRVLDIEKLTGISRHVLRPDVFGDTA